MSPPNNWLKWLRNLMLRMETHPSPAIEKISGTQSLRDTLTLMKRSKNFLKLGEKDNGDVFWNIILIRPLGDKRIGINDELYDITSNIQACFINTKLTTKSMDNEDKLTVFNILENVGPFDRMPKIGLKSARMRDASYNLPKAVAKIRNLSLPAIENIEVVSDNLQGE